MTYPDSPVSRTFAAGSLDEDTRSTRVPSAHASLSASHGTVPIADRDNDDQLPDGPPQYEGPAVRDQPPMLNPMRGYQGPDEGAGKYGVGGRQLFTDTFDPPGADLNPEGPIVDGSVADDVRAARG